MKVYKFKCDSCGSKRCVKVNDGYKCEYCGSVQDVIMPSELKKEEQNQSAEQNGETIFINHKQLNTEQKSILMRLIICVVAGVFGAHEFMERKFFVGLVYLFTFGLFGIGIFIDFIKYAFMLDGAKKNKGMDE